MPLDFQTTEIPFGALSQKHSAITRPNGALEHAINVEFDKVGRLNKRRGYQFVDVAASINRLFDDDAIMMRVATLRDELVIFTYDYVAALGDRNELLTITGHDASIIYRGPCNRGNAKLRVISSSQIATGAEGDGNA